MIAAAGNPAGRLPGEVVPGDAVRPEAAPASAAGRIGWVDNARGLGIVLVVAGHALGGLIDSPLGLGAGAGLFRQAFFAIYAFHMPLFFLLSGLLVAARVQRDAARFARSLGTGIAWPYFLWSTVQFSVIWALGSLVNRPAGTWLPTVLSLPWSTVSQFWFLYALFWMHLIALAMLPHGGWRGAGRAGLVMLGIAFKLAVACVAMPVTVKLVANNLVWYALGVWLGAAGMERLVAARSIAARAVALPLLAMAAVGWALHAGMAQDGTNFLVASSPQLANLAWRLPVVPAALCGTVAMIALASLLAARGGVLARLGQLTMPIFVLHVMFIAGTRIALVRTGLLTQPVALLAVLVIAGLAGPLLAERMLRPLGLQRWLGF